MGEKNHLHRIYHSGTLYGQGIFILFCPRYVLYTDADFTHFLHSEFGFTILVLACDEFHVRWKREDVSKCHLMFLMQRAIQQLVNVACIQNTVKLYEENIIPKCNGKKMVP